MSPAASYSGTLCADYREEKIPGIREIKRNTNPPDQETGEEWEGNNWRWQANCIGKRMLGRRKLH